MNKIKVSVIIPIYNAECYIKQCLDSVVNQTLEEIEIICVDDGSTDGTQTILKEYAKKDKRISLVTQKNKGAGAARNVGLEMANGEYLSLLDADDFFEPDMLEVAYVRVAKLQAQVAVYASDDFCEADGSFISQPERLGGMSDDIFSFKEMPENRLAMFIGWTWDKLFLRSFIEENGLRFQNLHNTNDAYFVFSALVRATKITVCAGKAEVHHRLRSSGSLSSSREDNFDCFYQALKALRSQIKEWGYWEWMERDFNNYAINLSLWHFNTMPESKKNDIYLLLHRECMNDFEADIHPEEYFYSKIQYAEAKCIMRYATYEEYTANIGSYIFPIKEIGNAKKIVVYGAGEIGRIFCAEIVKSNGKWELAGWVDKKYAEIKKAGFEVAAPETVNEICFDKILVAVEDSRKKDNIKNYLIQMGINEGKIVV